MKDDEQKKKKKQNVEENDVLQEVDLQEYLDTVDDQEFDTEYVRLGMQYLLESMCPTLKAGITTIDYIWTLETLVPGNNEVSVRIKYGNGEYFDSTEHNYTWDARKFMYAVRALIGGISRVHEMYRYDPGTPEHKLGLKRSTAEMEEQWAALEPKERAVLNVISSLTAELIDAFELVPPGHMGMGIETMGVLSLITQMTMFIADSKHETVSAGVDKGVGSEDK